jgi:hypothetical protein
MAARALPHHIRASRETRKPLIIHTRSASEDTIRIMQEEGAGTDKGGVAGVMHCFTESLEVAEAAIEMGFYISFSGIVTFKSAKDLQAVARAVPLERILIETDSPYLAPVPYRGKMNEPGFVPTWPNSSRARRASRSRRSAAAPPRISSSCSNRGDPRRRHALAGGAAGLAGRRSRARRGERQHGADDGGLQGQHRGGQGAARARREDR